MWYGRGYRIPNPGRAGCSIRPPPHSLRDLAVPQINDRSTVRHGVAGPLLEKPKDILQSAVVVSHGNPCVVPRHHHAVVSGVIRNAVAHGPRGSGVLPLPGQEGHGVTRHQRRLHCVLGIVVAFHVEGEIGGYGQAAGWQFLAVPQADHGDQPAGTVPDRPG